VTAIRHVAFEDLGLLEPLLKELAVMAGFSIAQGTSSSSPLIPCQHQSTSHGIDVLCLPTRNKYYEKYH